MIRKSLIALSTLTLGALAFGGVGGDSDLGSMTFGKQLMGPPTTLASVAGKVVLVEFWGTHCGPCRASLPGLAAFAKKHSNEPLAVLGFHAQNDTDDAITELCKNSGVEYPIFQNGQYPKKQFSGIPKAFVFDCSGHEIYDGNPGGAEEAAEKALKTTPSLYLGETSYMKLKPLADQIQKKAGLGAITSTLRKKAAESADETEKTEAQGLLAVLENYAKTKTESAASLRGTDPEKDIEILKTLAKEFAGDTLGNEAKAAADKEAADPEVKRIMAGLKEIAAQQKALEALAPCKACKMAGARHAKTGCEACKTQDKAGIDAIRKAIEGIAKKYEGTPVADQAKELTAKL